MLIVYSNPDTIDRSVIIGNILGIIGPCQTDGKQNNGITLPCTGPKVW